MSCCKYCPCNPSAIQSGEAYENCVCNMGLRTPVFPHPKPISPLCSGINLPAEFIPCDHTHRNKVMIIDDPGYHPDPGGPQAWLNPIRFIMHPLDIKHPPWASCPSVFDTYNYFINAFTRYS